MTYQEMAAKAATMFEEVQAVYDNPEATAEDRTNAKAKYAEAKDLKERAFEAKDIKMSLGELETELAEITDAQEREVKAKAKPGTMGFKSLREYWMAVHQAGNIRYRGPLHRGLKAFREKGSEPDEETWIAGDGSIGKEFKATMAENTGATGGFLVPPEYLMTLYGEDHERNSWRQGATIIPMRRRQVNIPVLDQTGTTAGQPHQFGGILSTWTEEGGEKAQHDPTFRQIELVAHKLVCYTRASDELLDDSAVGIDAFLRGPMGFSGAINWQEEWTFLRGTGAGQPLGVLVAGATIVVARAVAGTIGVADIMNMLMNHYGDNPVWYITRRAMATLLQLNGPALNPSYIFIPNAREGAPATLMGFPIIWTEKLPALGVQGDILLADRRYYLIGDRQATTVESTNIERFRHDETSWRAVHRVDGQPWLSAPWTLQDGTGQLSPFVILGDVAT